MEEHDGLVRKLELILFDTMDYEKVWKFMKYNRNGQVGEVDLLALADEIYDFYEVKRTFHHKSHKKAQDQYNKYKLAFPKHKTNGFMYSNKGIIRLQ